MRRTLRPATTPVGAGSSTAIAREKAVEFTECMRGNGVSDLLELIQPPPVG